jgi:hypothetical protein
MPETSQLTAGGNIWGGPVPPHDDKIGMLRATMITTRNLGLENS